MKNGMLSAGRVRISERTLRTDKWWLQPFVTFAVLISFVIYSTFRAFENANYYATPLLSPFYSPCLAVSCVPGSSDLGQPIGSWFMLSPAFLILFIPLGFRMTCYYYRRSYYRSFWLSPPACGVGEPHSKYTGETRAPLILQNAHRYFFYLGLLLNFVLTYDVILAFRNDDYEWGHLSVGTLVLFVNASLLWLYSLSCHSCRHALGGRLKHFSKNPIRYKLWTWTSNLNAKHPMYAWISLLWVAFTDFYVRSVSTGFFTNFYIF